MRREIYLWLKSAEEDISDDELFFNNSRYFRTAFFSQQAVEKYLKAFLAFHNIPFGKTHNIAKLIEMCSRIDGDFEYLFEIDADRLYPIGITIRYPVDFEISVSEAREFVKTA